MTMLRLTIALLVLALPSLASTPLTIEDYATMPGPADPQISPDGKRVAYVVTRADMTRSAYDADVWLVDVEGRRSLQLTRAIGSDNHPRWSPDSQQIAFLSEREGKAAIYLIDPSGGEAVRLTPAGEAVRSFAWSHDGKSIAFIAAEPVSAEAERRARERDDARVIGSDRRQQHLWIIDVSSSRLRRMTRGNWSVLSVNWSPGGKSLAIDRAPGGGLDDLYRSDIYLLAADGECSPETCPSLRPLVVRPGWDRHPRFSPDGKMIAFTSTGGTFDWLREHDINVMPIDGGKPRMISAAYNRTPESIAWSVDGRAIVFDGPLDSTSQLFTVGIDGSGFRNISNHTGTVREANVSRNLVAFVMESLTAPPEVFVSDVARFAPRQLTRHNEALRNRLLGATRLIRWKNPADGMEIEGLLTLPTNYAAGKKVPLLTFVHGGPASRFEQTFLGYLGPLHPTHVYAAAGYAILRPNPRGSGGYGEAFRQANRGDWAGKDWADINAGIDSVIASGVADPDRLGLMGWSYGGYIAAWAIGHSERFRAISVGAAIVDLLSFHGTSDIRDYVPFYFPSGPPVPPPAASPPATDAPVLEEMRHAPLSLDMLRERSPLWNLRKTKAAVLIQHGDNDERVPLSQGTMLYRILDELGVDVTMVVYPRSGHAPREPKLRMDVARRNVALFDRHVMRVTR